MIRLPALFYPLREKKRAEVTLVYSLNGAAKYSGLGPSDASQARS